MNKSILILILFSLIISVIVYILINKKIKNLIKNNEERKQWKNENKVNKEISIIILPVFITTGFIFYIYDKSIKLENLLDWLKLISKVIPLIVSIILSIDSIKLLLLNFENLKLNIKLKELKNSEKN